ncbi:Mce-associated membrane protein [Amycolatopsis marina]|uniref:Mce-associated membrane protein n=1 Tax=Amycolatopsis marina TaxID=490629 RepID=A0A1I0YM68_9PSEU|nr:hypothetical protein [Amycolatopsis marina]SFB13408.1 Mce-associated membrane protein [Amycolatopsis marina]
MTVNEEGTPDDGAARPLARRCRPVSAIAALGLALVCGAALIWALVLRHEEQVRAERETAAIRAATEHLEVLANLGHASAADVLAKLREGATGEFRRQLEGVGDPLFGLLEQGKVQSSGQVTDVALARIDDQRAEVLAQVDTTFVNTEHPEGQQRSYRSVVSLLWQDGRWLVENAETK